MAQLIRKIDAELREASGKGPARRLRRAGRVPAIVYGGGTPPLALAVDPRQVAPLVRSEAAHTSILTLEAPGVEPARVMLRDWQTDPVHGNLLHVDFVRIAAGSRVNVMVPIHITGEARGVKVQGGVFEFVLREVEVECLPDDIPENLSGDVTDLAIGRNLRVSQLQVSPNVKVLTDPSRVVARVVALKAAEEKPAGEVAEAGPAEPELIRKGKAEAEGKEQEAPEGTKEKKS